MSNIIIGKSDGRNITLDLDVLLRTRMLIQAASGQGKSHLIRRLVEQLAGKVQIFIIDHEGEFSTLREKFNFVLIGEGGEARPDIRTAGLLANRLLELNASTIFDLSEAFRAHPSQRPAYVHAFLSAMMEAPRNLWHPVLVIVDEAHKYCPEKDEAESSEAMVSVATDGRKRQFCAVWATQRLSKLNKDAAAELLNKAIGGTVLDIDVKRAADDLGFYGDDLRAFKNEIKVIERGNFYVLGQAICTTRTLVKIGEVETHPPQTGRKAAPPPPAPEKVKELLPKLADLPKEAEEKARTENELRSENRKLKMELRNAPVATREVKVADPQAIAKAVTVATATYRKMLAEQAKVFHEIHRYGNQIALAAERAGKELPKQEAPKILPAIPRNFPPRPAPREAVCESQNDGKKLRSGAERMLAALAQWSPEGMGEGQMRAHAGLKKSGTFSAYMSDLRTGAYIEERGGMIYATESGLAYCKTVPSAPQTTEEVLSIWEPKLRDGARRMLRVLVDSGGEPVTKEELGERASLSKSGTFSAYLSDLKTARLVTVNRDGTVAANKETLFL